MNNAKNEEQQSNGREFFTLGEHTTGSRHYRFRFDGRVYRILERRINPSGDVSDEEEETLTLEETDSRKAYDAWNHIKRPERFGGSKSEN